MASRAPLRKKRDSKGTQADDEIEARELAHSCVC